MAKLSLLAGTTSKLIDVFIQDSSSSTGAGLTGLAYNTASLTGYYYREGAASAVAITLATMTLGTWASGGFIVVDGTNMPGCYQLGIPNAAIAAGAKSVIIMLKGAANMAPLVIEIELTAIDNQDSVRAGMTALPNAAAAASGGLVINGSNTGTVTLAALTITGAMSINGTSNVAQTGDSYAKVDTEIGTLQTTADAIKAKTDNLPASPAAVGSAMTLTSGERNSVADALLDRANGVETGLTPRQSMQLWSAALAGVLSGAGTTTITIKGAGVATTRITATVDVDGNRSALTLNV